MGIFVALRFENEKQRDLVDSDLVGELRAAIRNEGLANQLEVVVVPAHHYSLFLDRDWLEKKAVFLRGRFFLCATVREFPDTEKNKVYCTKIKSAVVAHRPLLPNEQKRFHEELSSVLNTALLEGEISFPESFTKGFEITGRLVHFTATYIVGRAAYISGQMEQGLAMHEKMITSLNVQELSKFKNFLSTVICGETHDLAASAYRSSNFDKALVYTNRVLDMNPRHGDALLLLGILYFKNGDVDAAIASTKKAYNLLAKSNKVPLFNLAFLYLWKNDDVQAPKWVRKVQKSSSTRESVIIDETLAFCEKGKLAEQNANVHFWLAVIFFYKKKDYALARKHITSFFLEGDVDLSSRIAAEADSLRTEIDREYDQFD